MLVKNEKMLPLFTPIDEKLFFAGEHTTYDENNRGTMEAAAESGARMARLILKYLEN